MISLDRRVLIPLVVLSFCTHNPYLYFSLNKFNLTLLAKTFKKIKVESICGIASLILYFDNS